MNSITSTIIAAALVGAAPTVSAISLETLFAGEEITVDDKRFYDWTLLNESRVFRGSGGDAPQPTGTDYSKVEVQGSSVDALNQLLGYNLISGSGFAVADPSSGLTEILDVVFSYKVETISGQDTIVEDTLEVTDLSASVLYSFSIDETLGGAFGGVGSKRVFSFDDSSDSDADLIDVASFAPQSFLFVTTTIHMAAAGQGPDNGHVTLNSFEQSYRQVTVPVPATLGLLVVGLAGIRLQRKLR